MFKCHQIDKDIKGYIKTILWCLEILPNMDEHKEIDHFARGLKLALSKKNLLTIDQSKPVTFKVAYKFVKIWSAVYLFVY